MAKSDLEDWLETRLIQSGLTGYVREFQAINGRKWRWDFAYVDARLLIEVHGGTWGKGGHSSGEGKHRAYIPQWAVSAIKARASFEVLKAKAEVSL